MILSHAVGSPGPPSHVKDSFSRDTHGKGGVATREE